jgi:hypothetical protein
VAHCRACRELVMVKQAFRSDRAIAGGAAKLESPGVLWWRAQLRRRNAAIERIGRPILGAQIFAAAFTLLGAILFLAAQARRGFDVLAWVQEIPRALHFEALLPNAFGDYQGGTWLVIGVAALLALMSGVIIYVASEKR